MCIVAWTSEVQEVARLQSCNKLLSLRDKRDGILVRVMDDDILKKDKLDTEFETHVDLPLPRP